MIYLKCTNAVLRHIRLRKDGLETASPSPAVFGNWYVNLFPVDGRIAFLYMSERTFLSFILMEGMKIDAARLSGAFIGGLAQVLAIESYSELTIDRVVADYEQGMFAHSRDASDLGSLTNLIQDYRGAIDDEGGLVRCDIGRIIMMINRRPNKRLGWHTPLEMTAQLLDSAAT